MPQMNPMNWLLLFIYFNVLLYLSMIKVSFLGKEIAFLSSTNENASSSKASLKLKI